MDRRLSFFDWSELVCGRYRIADESLLKSLWEKDWLPQQAIEHLQRTKQFHKRYRHLVPFWDAWKGPMIKRTRRRAIYRFDIQCRLAQANLREIRKIKQHRLEPDDLAFVNKLAKQCEAQLEQRARIKGLRDHIPHPDEAYKDRI